MRILTLPLLLGCTDYNFAAKSHPAPGDTAVDTADTASDTGTAADTETADTGATDSGGVLDTDTDTGVATESVYINTGSTLYSFDPSTSTATTIGDFSDPTGHLGGMTDIAIDLSGHMFGVSYKELFEIDATNANATWIATLADSLVGLTFVSDGRLVGAGDRVVFIDTTTGHLTSLVPAGGSTTSGDIIGLPDGYLYWTVSGGDGLVRIDPSTGDTTRMGDIGVASVFGLGYADGELLGFTSAGKAIVIDAATANVTHTASVAGSWYGATTNPVLW